MTDPTPPLPDIEFNPDLLHIVCAVRGIPESFKTVETAIGMASHQAARLTFLLILNIEFLGDATPVLGSYKTVERQLISLGEFTLLSLRDEALQRGVARCSGVVRLGDFRKQLRIYLNETHADALVISRLPPKDTGEKLPPKDFAAFITELERDLQIEVLVVEVAEES